MANNQDLEMNGEDFSEDVRAGSAEDDQMNGSDSQPEQQQHSTNGTNGSAETSGRDDDR